MLPQSPGESPTLPQSCSHSSVSRPRRRDIYSVSLEQRQEEREEEEEFSSTEEEVEQGERRRQRRRRQKRRRQRTVSVGGHTHTGGEGIFPMET